MNELQLLKIYGQLPNVMAKDLPSQTISVQQKGLLEEHTCGCPDVADQEIAETDDSEVDALAKLLDISRAECIVIIDAHRRMLLSDAEDYNNNRWGKCHPDIVPNNHSLTYYLDLDTFPSHYKRPTTREELERIVEAKVFRWTLEQLLDECLGKPMVEVAYEWFIAEAYRVLGCQHIRVMTSSHASHNVHIYSTSLAGSVIGRAWFPDGSCKDHVDHQIDRNYKPDLIGMCKLGCHEFGHNHGEPHQFSGQNTHQSVMSYSPPRLFYGFSTGQPPHKLPTDRSLKSLTDKYGGVPVPLKDDPKPIPKPEDPTTPIIDLPKNNPNGIVSIDGKLWKIWLEQVK